MSMSKTIKASRKRALSVPPADLDDALKEYEHWRLRLAGYSHATWAGEKSTLLAFIDAMHRLDVTYVAELTADHAEAWFTQVREGYAESTVATRLSQVRSFLRFCTDKGWLAIDPTALLRARPPIRMQRERLDVAELLSLVDTAACPRDRALLAIASNLALRAGEIQRLQVSDVNLDAGYIQVRIDKTRESDNMPITVELDDELRRWLAVYSLSTPGFGRDSYLIPSRYVNPGTGTTWYRPDKQIGQPYDVVKDALTQIGWDVVKGEGVHTLRRSVARLYFDMIEGEESYDSALLATMTLLHHTKPETTIGYIGRDRATLARDRMLKGKPFLSRLAGNVRPLRSVK